MKENIDNMNNTYVFGARWRHLALTTGLILAGSMLSGQAPVEGEAAIFDLDALEVVSEADSYSNAIETMRSSVNNITVLDSGAFGDVTEGNVGEFMKYLPGVSVDYVAADVRAISVRGLASNFTPVTVDGNRMASAASSNALRTFELEQVSLNNVERIEVAKVPRPDMWADSLGGSVNLVSKSAFDADKARIDYKAYFSFNTEDITFSKSPGWGSQYKHKIYPGVDFSYYNVIADGKVGIRFSYLNSNQFNPQHRSRFRWEFDEINKNVADPIPVLQRYQMQDGPKFTHRESFSLRADFKISEKSTLTTSLQWNDYESEFRNTNVQWDTNQDERSDSRGNIIEEGYVESRVGGGDIDYDGSWRNKFGDTWHGDITFKHFGDDSLFDIGVFYSIATNHYDDVSAGYMNTVTLDYDWPGTIILSDFGDARGNFPVDRPTITLLDKNGVADPGLGVSDLSIFDWLEVDIDEADSEDEFRGAKVNYLKTLDLGETRLDLKVGAAIQNQNREAASPRIRLLYTGSDDVVGDLLNEAYSYTDPGWGLPPLAWPDYVKGYEYFIANRDEFVEGSRAAANFSSLVNEVFALEEDISAAYAMFQWHLMDNRLSILGGLRWEETTVKGIGNTVFDGEVSPYVDTSSYDDIYPSLHFKYDITDHIVARLAYAKTIGRPNFSSILPMLDIDSPTITEEGEEPDPEDGRVDVNNTGLLPQEADNFDLSLEYYNSVGGVFSVGLFRKDFTNYIIGESDFVTQAVIDEFSLPAETLGYRFTTDSNGGDAKIEGIEFNVIQSLRKMERVPEWTRPFTVFLNGTFMSTEGDFGGSTIETDLEEMTKNSWNLGLTYEVTRLKIQVKFNDQGAKLLDRLSWNEDAKLIWAARETVDVNLEYRFSKRAKVFVNARNIFDAAQDQLYRSDEFGILALDRRETFGTQVVVGVKGTY